MSSSIGKSAGPLLATVLAAGLAGALGPAAPARAEMPGMQGPGPVHIAPLGERPMTPPVATGDAALDAQRWAEYHYERGYEAGREAALRWMREYSPEERAAMSDADRDRLFGDTRLAERDALRLSDRYVPPAPATASPTANPWWYDDWGRIAAGWPSARQDLLQRFPKLTAADLDRTDGRRAEIVALLQSRYNLSSERAHERLLDWQQHYRG